VLVGHSRGVLPNGCDERERKNAVTTIRTLPLIVLGLIAAGCSKEKQGTPASLASQGAPVPSAAATQPSAPTGGARNEQESNALFEFEYSYPAAAGAIPALKAELDAELERAKAQLAENAKEQQAESRKNGFPFNPLGSWTAWKVVADLPAWLSLSAEVGDFMGGAHPNHGFAALVWDRQANKRRAPVDLFTSKAALSQAIRKDFCAAIDKQRAKKRGEPVQPGSTDEFDRCIDPAASTIILGSTNGKAFDRIGVLVAPYEAGPYAEGDYEVTLPVTPAVMAAVKPEYRATFVTGR
jgi:hypothetical protein